MSFVPTVTIELKEYRELVRLSKVASNKDRDLRVLLDQVKSLVYEARNGSKLGFDRQTKIVLETISSLRGEE